MLPVVFVKGADAARASRRADNLADARGACRPRKAQSAIVPSFNRDLGDWFEINAAQVERNLGRYFGGKLKDLFTRRWFDHFAAIGDPADSRRQIFWQPMLYLWAMRYSQMQLPSC